MIATLKIGAVARGAGVSVDAVRFYERRGVLPPPRRRASGYREYTGATVERIRFAKALQALGFTLGEVVCVLRDVDAGTASCEQERPRFEQVLGRIDAKIDELTALRRSLVSTLRACGEGHCAFADGTRRGRVTARRGAPARAPRAR